MAFLVAAADALFAAGDEATGKNTLSAALSQIERRSSKVADPAVKRVYLTRRRENRRAFELAMVWIEPGE